MFALTGVVVACQATLPTDAEIEQMDVAAATRTARELSGTSHADTGVAYTLDGVKATTSEVSALAASELGKVQIVTSPRGTPAVINILTQRSAQGAAAGDSGRMRRTALMRNGTAGETTTVPELKPLWTASKVAFTGQIFIDGVRATEAQLRQLGRDQIESVDVLKGAYAAQLYNDPEAAKGVILIKTKGGRG